MADQQAVSHDQQSVQSAEKALAQMLSSQSTAAVKPVGAPSGQSATSPSKSPAAASVTPTTPAVDSAAQLASDQAGIDADQAALVSSQQSLANARLSAPIAGTVSAVTLSPSSAIPAGSTTSYITISNPAAYEVTTSLTSSQVGEVAVGDTVQVQLDGQSRTTNGTVSEVGPATGSGTAYNFRLVVALATGSLASSRTMSGATARLSVDTADVSKAVILPTSAVRSSSPGNSYVTVLQSGHPVHRTVKVGVVSGTFTQITSGLTAGTVVILADPSQAVPSSSTNSTTGFGRGGAAGGLPTGPQGLGSRTG